MQCPQCQHENKATARLCESCGAALARRPEVEAFELRAATSLARFRQLQGKRAPVGALLLPVYEWFTEAFDTRNLKEAKALLAELG